MCEVIDNVGQHLRMVRGRTKQSSLTMACGISDNHISAIENGHKVPTWETFAKLVHACGYLICLAGTRSDISASINAVLLEQRERRGWNQEYAGRQIGIARAYLSTIENGILPSWRVLSRMMRVYDLKLELVFASMG